MKNNLLILSFVCIFAMLVSSCEGPVDQVTNIGTDSGANIGDATGNSNSGSGRDTMTVLSPDAQKDYLVEVGAELAEVLTSAVLHSATPVVDLAEDLLEKYINYKWNEIGEQLSEELEDLYSSEFESFFNLPRRMVDVINGKKNASLEDLEILLTLSKFGYRFEFDDEEQTIIITKVDDPSIIATFFDADGVKCELKVWGVGQEKECSYSYEDYHYSDGEKVSDGTRTIRVKIPATIKMHFKHGNNELTSYSFNWDTNFEDYFNNSMNLKVMEFGIEETSKVSTKEAFSLFAMTCGNKNVITTAINLPKYKLIPWENGSDFTMEDAEEWIDGYVDQYEALLGELGKGELMVDVLGKMQLVGKVSDGSGLIDAYADWNNKYAYSPSVENEWEQPYNSLASQEDLCEIYDDYVSLAICYNGTDTEQAQLKLQPYKIEGSYWDQVEENYTEHCYYSHEPVLYFPQEDLSIAILTYLSSGDYSNVFNIVEKAAKDLIALDKNHYIFPKGVGFN